MKETKLEYIYKWWNAKQKLNYKTQKGRDEH